ncbi:hypothetical protein [Heyndrickxia acidiproducens]|uniref:hypothetical protein n=1 Tax=Heyndrickxia acidiproducens TaxID=1121084 RepID=UPI000362F067|nr:hypothetical protein [Heyndrickxia acidiproducens]
MNKKIMGFIAILGFVLILASCQNKTSQQENTEVKNDVGLSEKQVEAKINVQQNGKNNLYAVNLTFGKLNKKTAGKVLTDMDCAADKKGVSRCKSKIKLANGNVIKVISPHNMEYYRCYNTGEKVNVIPGKDGQTYIQVKTSSKAS